MSQIQWSRKWPFSVISYQQGWKYGLEPQPRWYQVLYPVETPPKVSRTMPYHTVEKRHMSINYDFLMILDLTFSSSSPSSSWRSFNCRVCLHWIVYVLVCVCVWGFCPSAYTIPSPPHTYKYFYLRTFIFFSFALYILDLFKQTCFAQMLYFSVLAAISSDSAMFTGPAMFSWYMLVS